MENEWKYCVDKPNAMKIVVKKKNPSLVVHVQATSHSSLEIPILNVAVLSSDEELLVLQRPLNQRRQKKSEEKNLISMLTAQQTRTESDIAFDWTT